MTFAYLFIGVIFEILSSGPFQHIIAALTFPAVISFVFSFFIYPVSEDWSGDK